MDFTKVRLVGTSNVDLPISGVAPSDMFVCKGIDGLGPTERNVVISNTRMQGGVYQGYTPQNRQIVALVGLSPDWATGQTASDLRELLYGLLFTDDDDSVTVQIMNGSTVLMETVGYAPKMEINPFTKDPEVQITIDCLSPYFQDPTEITVDTSSLGSASILTFDNPGSAPSGYHLEFAMTSADSQVGFWNDLAASNKFFSVTYDFLIDDHLIIDTTPGIIGVYRTRPASADVNLLYALDPGYSWIQVKAGTNVINSFGNIDMTDCVVKYTPQYTGV